MARRETRKRLSADPRKKTQPRAPCSLTIPEDVASRVVCLRWRSRGGTPGPTVLLTNVTTHLSHSEAVVKSVISNTSDSGYGRGKERKKEIEGRGADAEERT